MESKYTKEDLERLRKIREENPELLTPEEKRLANLHPIEKGEVRNPEGRKKGTKNWSTHFKRLMGDEDFLKTIIGTLPSEWNGIVGDVPADVLAAGLIASAVREVAKATNDGKPIDKKTLDILDRISKFGYGDKVVHEIEDEEGFFDKKQIVFQVVDSKKESSNNNES